MHIAVLLAVCATNRLGTLLKNLWSATCQKHELSHSVWLLQTELASAEGELEDADLEVADLPAPAVPAAAAGDVDQSKKKRKAKSDEDNGASGSKDAPASPQVCLLLKQTVCLHASMHSAPL